MKMRYTARESYVLSNELTLGSMVNDNLTLILVMVSLVVSDMSAW